MQQRLLSKHRIMNLKQKFTISFNNRKNKLQSLSPCNTKTVLKLIKQIVGIKKSTRETVTQANICVPLATNIFNFHLVVTFNVTF